MTSLSLLAPTLTAGVLLSLLSLLLCLSWAGSSSVPCLRVTCSISSAQLSLNALGTALWLSCCCSPVVLAGPRDHRDHRDHRAALPCWSSQR